MSGKLYIVGTPIGNLNDFSPRAISTLKEVDFIAAEDTRVTLKLLNHFEIKKPMVSYHKHNYHQCGEEILARLNGGESCALVTDAGMPAISDPGEDLVRLCNERGIKTVCVPSATAFASAVAMSGLPSGRFTFEGFISVNKKERKEHLESLQNERRTMVMYEAPHKLGQTLADLYDALGNRKIAIVREITKIYEEVIETTLENAKNDYADNSLKGEIVLVIEGKTESEKFTSEQAVEIAKKLINAGNSVNNAAKEAAKITGIKKSEIYKKLL